MNDDTLNTLLKSPSQWYITNVEFVVYIPKNDRYDQAH
jgi:hypothetical protein